MSCCISRDDESEENISKTFLDNRKNREDAEDKYDNNCNHLSELVEAKHKDVTHQIVGYISGFVVYNLCKHNIQGIVNDGVKRVGRNRFSVEFNSAAQTNNFLVHPSLTSADYSAVIPSFHVSRMGIIRDISPEWAMQEIIENVTVPLGFDRAIKARRLSRKSFTENNTPIWIPTRSVVLTFSGRCLPPNACFAFTIVYL